MDDMTQINVQNVLLIDEKDLIAYTGLNRLSCYKLRKNGAPFFAYKSLHGYKYTYPVRELAEWMANRRRKDVYEKLQRLVEKYDGKMV